MNPVDLRRRDILLAATTWLFCSHRAFARPRGKRRLSLVNENTGETFDGVYRDEAGLIPSAASDLAVFLRDHHANRIGPVDLDMLDFLADVMAAVGQRKAVVLSAYRTPETNAMLAATTFGVAENSQHIFGRAIDVTLDRRLTDAVRAARRMKRGGVGWYPDSHFVHLDSGPIRNWNLRLHGIDKALAGRTLRHGRTVAERAAVHRAVARREFLARSGLIGRGLP